MTKQYPLPSDTPEEAYKKLKAIVNGGEQVDLSLVQSADTYESGKHKDGKHPLTLYKVREYRGTHKNEDGIPAVVELDYLWSNCAKCGKRWSKVVASTDLPPLWHEHYFYKQTDD